MKGGLFAHPESFPRRRVLDVKPVDATPAAQSLKVGGELAKLADITTFPPMVVADAILIG